MKRNKFNEVVIEKSKLPEKVKLSIQFKANEYFPECDEVEIELTAPQVDLIKTGMEIANGNTNIFSVNIDNCCEAKYLIDGKEDTEFYTYAEYFICYPDSAYFYAQSKHDAASSIESEAMKFNSQ